MAADKTKSNPLRETRDFNAPPGFSESFDPPNQIQGSIAQAFVESDGKGYIVLKRLNSNGGEMFWHIEQWRYTGDYYTQETSYAATDHAGVSTHVEDAADDIRDHDIVNPSFARTR